MYGCDTSDVTGAAVREICVLVAESGILGLDRLGMVYGKSEPTY
jgi:hypothetical protein